MLILLAGKSLWGPAAEMCRLFSCDKSCGRGCITRKLVYVAIFTTLLFLITILSLLLLRWFGMSEEAEEGEKAQQKTLKTSKWGLKGNLRGSKKIESRQHRWSTIWSKETLRTRRACSYSRGGSGNIASHAVWGIVRNVVQRNCFSEV